VPSAFICRRQALSRWYRRKAGWMPLWLNSNRGRIGKEPSLASWGRLEQISGAERLTALVLRDEQKELLDPRALPHLAWSGRWALISQDDRAIFQSRRLACIPFGGTFLRLPCECPPTSVMQVFSAHEQPYTDWQWTDDALQLSLPAEAGSQELLGFLVLHED